MQDAFSVGVRRLIGESAGPDGEEIAKEADRSYHYDSSIDPSPEGPQAIGLIHTVLAQDGLRLAGRRNRCIYLMAKCPGAFPMIIEPLD